MGSLIVPSGVAIARRTQIAQQRGHGLGKMLHDVDPVEKIKKQMGLKKLGVVPGFRVMGNRVLVAIYERPEALELAGGKKLYLADGTRGEDEHQGKAGLVIACGRSAFVSDDFFDFGDDKVEPGDWVSVHVTDGRKIVVLGQLCRIVRDQDIALKILAPDSVY